MLFYAIKLAILTAALPEARDELQRVWNDIKPEVYERDEEAGTTTPRGLSNKDARKARLEAYLAGDKGAYFS